MLTTQNAMFCKSNRFKTVLKQAKKFSYFHDQTGTVLEFDAIPTPKGLPLIGTTLSLLTSGSASKLHKYIDKRHKQLGPIFKEKIGPIPCIFISNADEMRNIFAHEGKYPIHILPESWMVYNELYSCSRGLFFMNGEEWLHFRKLMNKLLLKGDLTWLEKACEEISNNMVEKINNNNIPNTVYKNLDKELYKWSLDVIVCVLLGTDVYKVASKSVEKLVKQLSETVHLVFETSGKLSLISAKFAAKYRLPAWNRFEKSVDEALLNANELVEELLQKHSNGDGLLHKMRNENMNRSEIIRIVVDLILAAGDTTAYTMQWLLYLISKNKNIQNKLREEVKENGELTQFSKNILRETLRLYPVAPFLTRILTEDCTVNGYRIAAGNLLIMSIFTSGRDSNYFSNPEEFNPDRWLKGSGNLIAKASLPFAMGARSCVGRKIAELQLQLTLAKIVQNFDIELCNEKDVDVVLKMVAVPSHPVRLKFNKLS